MQATWRSQSADRVAFLRTLETEEVVLEGDGRISRRGLIGGGVAGALGASLAGAAGTQAKALSGQKQTPATQNADVCVIGAGISGLSAARALVKAGKTVVVLEARDRVGGRCYSVPIPNSNNAVANMGATFVGPTQSDVLALMDELQIDKYPVYSTGKLLWYENGSAKPYTGTVPPLADPAAELELGLLLPRVDQMAKSVPAETPWTAPNAASLDAETLASWTNQNVVDPNARKLVALLMEAILSVEPADLSMLYTLWYINMAGSIETLVGNAGSGGAQDFLVQGGTQSISEAMASQLGDRVLLNNPVRRISQNANGATVYADNATVTAQQVIVAMPPTLTGKIDYEPQLTAMRTQLVQRMPIGSLIKTIAVYDEPFWRSQGLNGQVTSDTGPVKVVFDASPPSGSPGVLLGFMDGDDARQYDDADPATRQAAALKSYVNYFGSEAGQPRWYQDHVWAQELYTGGCPACITPPGVLTEYGQALRQPVGRIHWAGTETATVWMGYMSGGVQAGQRAASEVIQALR
ncbi:MAG: flavin monoamine oxidase family protein [Solirubrobacterales bacterium]|nr:flavin monoamine oxidase family protein [Solirubrobacterales bacterium]